MSSRAGSGERSSMMEALMVSMQVETDHEMRVRIMMTIMTTTTMMTKVRSRGKRTKYNRTSPVTEYLGHNFMIMTALQGAAEEQRSSGEFFRTRCQELSSVPVTCTESPDGRFRTINGCSNNLDNPQYGEYGTVQHSSVQFSSVQYSLV